MASTKGAYPFSRDFKASARLNLQHFLYKKDVGWLVHPSIGIEALHNPKIADVGTGTGIWLIDVADELPSSATLDGFDISDEQYPPEAWLPPNVHLSIQDAFADLRDELAGKYDVVNIRYFLQTVRDNKPHRIVEQAFKMLKPGGYLQWSDFDGLTTSNEVDMGATTEPWDALVKEIEVQTNSSPARFQWLNDMVDILKQTGFTDVIKERKFGRKDFYSFWQHVNLEAADEISHSAPDGDKIRQLVARNQVETPRGVYWKRPHIIFVAKKPLQ